MAGSTSAAATAALTQVLSGGTESDLQVLGDVPARGIGFLMRVNNEQQQALIKTTILELIAQNNEDRRQTHEEFDKKVEELKRVMNEVHDARMTSERERASHDATIQAELAKADQFRTDLADVELKMAALNSDILSSTARTQHELTDLLSKSRTDFDKLVANVKGEFVKVRGEMSEAATGMGFKPRSDKPQGLVDSRDFKVSMMPESCNAEQFKKWRHDALVFLEAHPKWAGAKKILGYIRKAVQVIDTDAMFKAINDANSECNEETGSPVTDPDHWTFLDRSRELYQLLSVKLNSSAFADFKDEDNMNGFELWRQLNKSKDPIRQDIAFHLELAIQNMATTRENNFESTYNRMLEIDKAAKNYKSVVGEAVDKQLLSRVLYAVTDDDTTALLDRDEKMCGKDHEDFYVRFKEWLNEKFEKQAGRTAVRSHQRPRSSAMQVGALDAEAKPQAEEPPPAAPGHDPWATGAADPWACQPCGDQGWGSGGFIDAFGKGGKDRGPMACWNCEGLGHPSRLCPAPPGAAKTGPRCSICNGFGHVAQQCTSKGGGKYTEPPKGGKGKGAGDKGGKGYGGNGGNKGWKGKGWGKSAIFMVERGKECRHLRLGPVRSFGEIREERMQARHRRHHGCNSRLGFIAWEIGATAHRGGKHMGSLEE